MNKYLVVTVDESADLYAEFLDTYDEALAHVESSDDKALIVKMENLCDQGMTAPTVKVEYHT